MLPNLDVLKKTAIEYYKSFWLFYKLLLAKSSCLMYKCTVIVVWVSNLKSWPGSASWLMVSDKTATYLQSIKGDSDLNYRSVRYCREFARNPYNGHCTKKKEKKVEFEYYNKFNLFFSSLKCLALHGSCLCLNLSIEKFRYGSWMVWYWLQFHIFIPKKNIYIYIEK